MLIGFARLMLLIVIPFVLLTPTTSAGEEDSIWWFLAGFLYAVLVMTILGSIRQKPTRKTGASDATGAFRRRD